MMRARTFRLRPRRAAGLTGLAGPGLVVLLALGSWVVLGEGGQGIRPEGDSGVSPLLRQSAEQALDKSRGCLSCHGGIEKPHAATSIKLGCVDCHGGDPAPRRTIEEPGSEAYRELQSRAHVAPHLPERWAGADGRLSSANPAGSYTLMLEESPEFVRFVNPGDLRVARQVCGPCHPQQVAAVEKSVMTTSSIFWAAAAYANGILGPKRAIFGESFGADGLPRSIVPLVPPTPEQAARGALPGLVPLKRWQTTQPGAYFRVFEDGGVVQPSAFPEIANPNPLEDPGRPDVRVSNRGRGTGLRVSPGILNLHKTRLNNPHLSVLGTNDQAGDYRSSGCSGCHLVYANDRDPAHSGPYAAFGHRGESASGDLTLPRAEPGHPIRHRMTRAVPTSQCMVCHMHQPNSFLNTYLGYTMWDYETDGEHLWPEEQRYPSAEERRAVLDRNPEGAAPRGLWADPEFLAAVSELNPKLSHTQFADYHGHGWVFRAVYHRDRQGHLLDAAGERVAFDDPERFQKAVHLKDIHLEKGMHCVDCHFSQDVHGDGLLYGEYGDALEIECQDCHGGLAAPTNLRTSGPAAPPGGTDLALGLTPDGRRRFAWRGDSLYQRSMLDGELEWRVPQVRDTVTPGHPDYSEASSRAKTLLRDGVSWGQVPVPGSPEDSALAHAEFAMTCYSCHSSWMTSCFGCHLPQQANEKSTSGLYEGEAARNYATYNPQVIRTDIFMLGRNSPVKGAKIAPVRSSSALVLSSVNANRSRIYVQQPPISTPGFSSQAFNPHVPHTVRGRETKGCSDCHLSEAGDNEAWMAQLLTQGTGFVNFIGRFAWVAQGDQGLQAVAVSEFDEPQAVIGSNLHRLAYPDFYAAHQKRGGELEESHHHHGHGEVLDLQLRGEYLFTAQGEGGFEVYDVANIDNKDFSERIVTAPVSPWGQRTFVRTPYATAVALPTTMPVAPHRRPAPENLERPMHPIYYYAVVSDRQEGLVLVDVATLTDGDPQNNFLERALAYNPPAPGGGGRLDGAETVTLAGTWAYVGCDRGLVVVDLHRPLEPRIVAELPEVRVPESIAVQFRYAYIAGGDGLTVVDITSPEAPRVAARVPLAEAHGVYVARTYAYVAAGTEGLVIVDVARPESPEVDQIFDGDGRLDDARDVQIGSTGVSLFAYVAAGPRGLAVVQLTSPGTVPGYLGFSPRPVPQLIATYATGGAAVALSRGLDRDRAVDETGHQVSVFNRLGARPLSRREMEALYLRDGEIYRVWDQPGDSVREGRGDKP